MAPKPFNAAQEAALKTMLDAVRPDADEAAGPSVQLLLHALKVFQHNADNKEKVEALLVQLTKSMRDGASNDDSLKGINACLKDSVTCQIRAICAVEALNTQGGEGEAERQEHQLAIVEELRNNAVRPLCHRMSANNMVAALGASLCSVPVRPKGAQYAYDKIEARKPAKLLGLVTTPAHIEEMFTIHPDDCKAIEAFTTALTKAANSGAKGDKGGGSGGGHGGGGNGGGGGGHGGQDRRQQGKYPLPHWMQGQQHKRQAEGHAE